MSHNYYATIYTSNVNNAGTDDDVYIQLIGTQGTEGDWYLDYDTNNDFEQGYIDTYILEAQKYIGPIKEILLYVKPTNKKSPDWRVDFIDIFTIYNGELSSQRFNVNTWIKSSDDNENYYLIDQYSTKSNNKTKVSSTTKVNKYGHGYKR
ncbi:PLAT/LH2 domain-containing protein [Paenibacillus terrae]|nr:PLAT/LH2 domain-containing protein [Paenibacillus terrae]